MPLTLGTTHGGMNLKVACTDVSGLSSVTLHHGSGRGNLSGSEVWGATGVQFSE
jgi:hypothetical protein